MAEVFEERHAEWISVVCANPRNLASELELLEQAKVALRRFLEADIDSSGTLSFDELKRLCDEMGLPMGEDEEEALIKMDTDGNGTLDIEEWVLWWLRRISTLPNPIKQQEAIAKNTFRKFDTDNSGYLNVGELAALLETLGADFTDEEMAAALDEMDTDHTGAVEINEFVSWWTNRAGSARSSSSLISLKLRKLAAKAAKQFSTDIFAAAWQGDATMVKAFLDGESRLAQATDDSEFGEGWSALQYAAYRGHAAIVKLLLDAGAQVNYANSLGFTALFYSAQQGHVQVCEELCAHGADPALFGCHAESETHFLCAADFASTYPALKGLFAVHKKMQPPEAVAASDVVQCALAGGQLTLELAPRKVPHLPIKAYRCRIEAAPCDEMAALTGRLTAEVVLLAKKPGSSTPSMSAALDGAWWEQLMCGLYLLKIETLRPTVLSAEVLSELWETLSIYYNALDSRRKRAVNLEEKLLAAIDRAVGAAEDVETAGKEAAQLKEQLKEQLQGLRASTSKPLEPQELLARAVGGLLALPKKAPEKRPSHAGGADRKTESKGTKDGDSKTVSGAEAAAASAATKPLVSKFARVVSSTRAPWIVTMQLSPINALKEGPVTAGVAVKVAYLKL